MILPVNKYIIALTGGIATGKSLVSGFLGEMGAEIVDTDKIARQVTAGGSPVLKKIQRHWGNRVLNPDGTLHRKALGDIIFSSKEQRQKLNRIIHPHIRREMNNQIHNSKAPVVAVVIPLLFETAGNALDYDEIWLVYCPPKEQLRRLMDRDGITEDEAQKRIESQIPIDEKVKLCQVVIDNSGDTRETLKQTELEWQGLLNRKGISIAGLES